MKNFLAWLANSPFASAVKVAVGAGLSYVLDNVASFDLPPLALVAITAGVPVLINYLNSEDTRYGMGSSTSTDS